MPVFDFDRKSLASARFCNMSRDGIKQVIDDLLSTLPIDLRVGMEQSVLDDVIKDIQTGELIYVSVLPNEGGYKHLAMTDDPSVTWETGHTMSDSMSLSSKEELWELILELAELVQHHQQCIEKKYIWHVNKCDYVVQSATFMSDDSIVYGLLITGMSILKSLTLGVMSYHKFQVTNLEILLQLIQYKRLFDREEEVHVMQSLSSIQAF